jgi:hypothetical protein
MKSRLYPLALAAALAVAAPAFGQQGPPAGHGIDNTSTVYGHPGVGGNVQSRVFTSAILNDASGNAVGKAKTATVQTTARGIVQGLRVQVGGLTPGAEYALVIDGTLVGTGTADSTGTLKLKFISPSNGRTAAIPDAIKPIANVHTVQIYEASSQRLAASGQFSSDSK